METLEQ